jgi:hypothetical protein
VTTSASQATNTIGGSDADLEFFERSVRPILASRCYGCHSSRIAQSKGSLQLDSYQAIVAGGDSGPAIDLDAPLDSLIAQAIRRETGLEMPPDEPLPPAEVEALTQWLQRGARWPQSATMPGGFDLQTRMKEHWVWQSPQPYRPPPHPMTHAGDPQRIGEAATSIDAMIAMRWPAEDAERAPPVDRLTLARRIGNDLLGLAIEPELVDAFVRDRSPFAHARFVDRVLARPEFGEKWARQWMDSFRYAETYGHEFDFSIPHAYRYRNYLIDAINDDVPYDRMMAEHIAGDLIVPRHHPPSRENVAAIGTTVWWLGQAVHAPVDVLGDRASRLEDQVDTFSKAFLGLTVACARCHDHKFDAISTADYYQLCGVFQSSRRALQWLDVDGQSASHVAYVQAAASELESMLPATQPEQSHDALARDSLRQHWKHFRSEGSTEHPQYALDAMGNAVDGTAWQVRWDEMVAKVRDEQQQWEQWFASTTPIADFTNQRPQAIGWNARGPCFSVDASPSPFDWLSSANALLPILAPHATTATVGIRLPGAIQSPTMELRHPVLCYRVRGKQATIRATIEGYYMEEFHNLLFADTQVPVDTNGVWRWVVQAGDLKKYLGQKIHLEAIDRGDGWFEIAQVRGADAPPPRSPNPALIALIEPVAPSSRIELLARMEQAFLDAARSSMVDGTTSLTDARRSWLDAYPDSYLHWRAGDRVVLEPLLQKQSTIQQADRKPPTFAEYLGSLESTGFDSSIDIRGNPRQPGEQVARGNLTALSAYRVSATDAGSGRLPLAIELGHSDHPLTGRVMVNRVWAQLFATGLVESTDNLGVLGSQPSHPELLDDLAYRFQHEGWSIKRLIRTIVLTDAYARGPDRERRFAVSDAQGRWLTHRKRKRLSAEAIRDRLLQLSGQLDRQMGGRSIATHITPEMSGRGKPASSGPLHGNGRRSVYLEVRRNFLHPFLVAFDAPLPQTSQSRRYQSNVPAQSLALLNDPMVHWAVEHWAARTMEENSDVDARIERFWRDALGRPPQQAERSQVRSYVEQFGNDPAVWRDIGHSIINSKEFIYLR